MGSVFNAICITGKLQNMTFGILQFIRENLGWTSPVAPQLLLSAAVVIIMTIVWFAIRRWTIKHTPDQTQLPAKYHAISLIIGLVTVLLITSVWLEGYEVTLAAMFSRFNELVGSMPGGERNGTKIVNSILIVLSLTIIRWLILRVVRERVSDVTQQYYWRRAVKYTTGGIMVLLIGGLWLDGLSNIGTFLGLVSAGLAIALQDPLVNLAAWLFILVRRPFKVGDRIEINGHLGDVIDIRLFQTYLLECGNWVHGDQSTGRIIMIPNGAVFKNATGNYTLDFEYIWDELPVLVTFESDWKKAKQILTDISNEHARPLSEGAEHQIRRAAAKHMIFYSKLTPIVYTDVRDSGVMLTIRYMTKPRNRRGNAQRIWEAILDAFAAENSIDFAYPSVRHYLNHIEGKENAKVQFPPNNG